MFENFNNSINFYKNALDGTWKRQEAISSNLSNVNTPKYKRKYVSFEEQLKSKLTSSKNLQLKLTNKGHIGKAKEGFMPYLHRDLSGSYRLDGNNIDIDREASDSAKNTIMYDALTRAVSSEFEKVKNVITEGSK